MKYLIGIMLVVMSLGVQAGAVATMPNNAGGKIVLTDEVCKVNNKTYDTLRRAYLYTEAGYTTEGCYTLEDETIVAVWNINGEGQKMRYSVSNFTLIRK